MSDHPRKAIPTALSALVKQQSSPTVHAQTYARLGWPVFPLYQIHNGKCTCNSPKCGPGENGKTQGSPGKHPRTKNGLRDASTDPAVIDGWWQKRWPAANIGIATGAAAGVWVLDIDPRHNGNESLAALVLQFGPLPETLTVATGGGGMHYYFRWPEAGEIRNTTNARPGIDARGTGGYVVAPPGNHISGGGYRWDHITEPAPAPAWLVELLTAPPAERLPRESGPQRLDDQAQLLKRADAYARAMQPAAEGERNSSAFSLAGHLTAMDEKGTRLTESQVVEFVRCWNQGNSPPLDDDELLKVVSSARQNGTARTAKPAREPAAPAEKLPKFQPDAPWGELIPFDDSALPSFPVDVLPPVLRQWVAETAHATQTPPDLAALVALATCRAAMRGRVFVEARPGWREPINIYTAVLMAPANRKSNVFRLATGPLRKIEDELREAARPAVAIAASEYRQKTKRLAKMEKEAAEKGDSEAREEALNLSAELACTIPPALPRLILENVTSEKMEMDLAQQGGVLAVMSPEGGVFDIIAGLYSNSANGTSSLDTWLKGHAGDDIATARVGRDEVAVKSPALTASFTVQPIVFEMLGENKAFRGRGLLGRFLYAVPESLIGEREIRPAPVSESTLAEYDSLIRRLAALEIDSGGLRLELSAEADRLFYQHEQWIEEELGDGGELSGFTDWGGKLAGATLRLAGILHMVSESPGCPIGWDSMRAAVKIAEYLVPHAARVFQMIQDGADAGNFADARYLVRWIKRHEKQAFSLRDAHQHCRRRFKKPEDMQPVLMLLAQSGYIRELAVPATGPGRPPGPQYQVNPALLASQPVRKRTQNSQKAPAADAGPDIVNSVNSSTAARIENPPAADDVEEF